MHASQVEQKQVQLGPEVEFAVLSLGLLDFVNDEGGNSLLGVEDLLDQLLAYEIVQHQQFSWEWRCYSNGCPLFVWQALGSA